MQCRPAAAALARKPSRDFVRRAAPPYAVQYAGHKCRVPLVAIRMHACSLSGYRTLACGLRTCSRCSSAARSAAAAASSRARAAASAASCAASSASRRRAAAAAAARASSSLSCAYTTGVSTECLAAPCFYPAGTMHGWTHRMQTSLPLLRLLLLAARSHQLDRCLGRAAPGDSRGRRGLPRCGRRGRLSRERLGEARTRGRACRGHVPQRGRAGGLRHLQRRGAKPVAAVLRSMRAARR